MILCAFLNLLIGLDWQCPDLNMLPLIGGVSLPIIVMNTNLKNSFGLTLRQNWSVDFQILTVN